MTAWARRVSHALVMLLAAACVVVGGSDAALAHFGGGREPSNYRGEITSVTPPLDGVSLRLVDSADRVEISSTSAIPVIVYGYQHKEPGDRDPYLKVSRDGVWVNTESQAGYLNESLYGAGDAVPERLTNDLGDGEPVWVRVSDTGTYRWHDHRVHWMSVDPPPVVAADPGSEHQIITDWHIYLKQGDAPESTVTGQLFWVPTNALPWWLVVAGLAIVGFALALVWRRSALVVGVGVLGVAALAQGALTPLPQDDYQGNFWFVLASAAVPALAVAGLCVLVVLGVRRQSLATRYLVGAAGALAALQGTSDLVVLTRSQLEHGGPAWVVRLAVAVVVGLGLGLLVGTVVDAVRRAGQGEPDDDRPIDIADDEEIQAIEQSLSRGGAPKR